MIEAVLNVIIAVTSIATVFILIAAGLVLLGLFIDRRM